MAGKNPIMGRATGGCQPWVESVNQRKKKMCKRASGGLENTFSVTFIPKGKRRRLHLSRSWGLKGNGRENRAESDLPLGAGFTKSYPPREGAT